MLVAEQITTRRLVSTSTPKAPASVDRRVLTRLNKKSDKTWSTHESKLAHCSALAIPNNNIAYFIYDLL